MALADDLPSAPSLPGRDAASAGAFLTTAEALGQALDEVPVFHTGMAILLELYRAEREGRMLSVSGIGLDFGIPQATMLRHLRELTDLGLVMRSPHARDRRVSFVRLMPGTLRKLDAVLGGPADSESHRVS